MKRTPQTTYTMASTRENQTILLCASRRKEGRGFTAVAAAGLADAKSLAGMLAAQAVFLAIWAKLL